MKLFVDGVNDFKQEEKANIVTRSYFDGCFIS